MEFSEEEYLNIPSDSVNYKLSLDNLDLALLPMGRLMDKYEAAQALGYNNAFPKGLFNSDIVEFEVSAGKVEPGCLEDNSEAIDEKTMVFCHICNITVLQQFSKEHNQSKLHVTLLRLANEAAGRLNKYTQQQLSETETYYCSPCNKEVESIENHEKEMKHQIMKRKEDLMATLLDVYTEEHEAYTNRTELVRCNLESLTENCSGTKNVQKNETEVPKEKNIIHNYTDTTTAETEACPQKLDWPLVKSEEKPKEMEVKEEMILAQGCIEIQTKCGDVLVVPQHHFHGIRVSSYMRYCMLCKEIQMSQGEVQQHINSSIHMANMQKLEFDKGGIRKNINLDLFGQSLGHCVVCNCVICDAILHIASPEHQKQYNKMKKSFGNCAVNYNSSTTAIENLKTNPDIYDLSTQTVASSWISIESIALQQIPTKTNGTLKDKPEKFHKSLKTTAYHQSPIEATFPSQSKLKNCVNGNSATTTSGTLKDEFMMSLKTIDCRLASSFASQGNQKTLESPTNTYDTQKSEDSDTPRKFNLPTNAYTEKTPDKNPVKTQSDEAIVAQDLIEMRTENGGLLMVPQYHFHGIGISTNFPNKPTTNPNAMRCMLCKKRGMSETHVEMHIKSSMHTDLIQKLASDKHGIRKIDNLIFSAQPLGHCVVCNFIICDTGLHIASPEHINRMKKCIVNKHKKYDLKNDTSPIKESFKAKSDKLETSLRAKSPTVPSLGCPKISLKIGNKSAITSNETEDSDPSLIQKISDDRNNVNRQKVPVAQELIEIRTGNGDLLTVPQNHFHGIRISSSFNKDNAWRCMLCKKRGMTETHVQMHIKSSTHTDLIQKLVLDQYGIRKVTNLVFAGQSLGHCVVCNFIICDAALHIASSEHQRHLNMMKRPFGNVHGTVPSPLRPQVRQIKYTPLNRNSICSQKLVASLAN